MSRQVILDGVRKWPKVGNLHQSEQSDKIDMITHFRLRTTKNR